LVSLMIAQIGEREWRVQGSTNQSTGMVGRPWNWAGSIALPFSFDTYNTLMLRLMLRRNKQNIPEGHNK